VIKNDSGEVIELRCTYDPATKGGDSPDGRKVKATLHWVSAPHAVDGQARLYDHLFSTEDPFEGGEDKEWRNNLNPNSKIVKNGVKLEPSLKDAKPFEFFQFERKGYFSVDPDSTNEKLIFNRSVGLRDTWEKIKKSNQE
jgi:glutaminyl-tRNA synthetase